MVNGMALPDATQALCQQRNIDVTKAAEALKILTALSVGEGQLLFWDRDAFVCLLAARSGAWEERQIGRRLSPDEEPFAFQAQRKGRSVFVDWGMMRGAEPFAHAAVPLSSLLILTLDLSLTDVCSLSPWQHWRFPRSLLRRIAAHVWQGIVPPEVLIWALKGRNGLAIWDEEGRLRWRTTEHVPPFPSEVSEGLGVTDEFVVFRTKVGTILRYRRSMPPLLQGYALIRSEVHHRVKNDLQSIVSWLRLQARQAPSEARQILLDAAERVRVFATVHDLLARAKSDWVALRELIQQLANTLMQQAKEEGKDIRYAVIGPEVLLNPQQASAVAAVVHEVLRNACNHAFQAGEEGTVTITLEPKEGWLWVEVADNGCGFALSQWNGQTLGLTIVHNLVKQDLRGDLHIHSQVGHGTVVRFGFPLSRETSMSQK